MASLPIEILYEAHLEQEEAFDWYHARNKQAAAAFVQEIKDARLAIQNSPEGWAKYLHGTRRYRLKRFPYLIVYRVTEHRIDIIAVAHGRRRPGYWVDRLGSLE
jgi:plasmid stabilization system protein ParE